jgi:hypothetical protein
MDVTRNSNETAGVFHGMTENQRMRIVAACMAAGVATLLAACASPAPSISPSPTTAISNISCEQPPQVTENGAAVKIVLECQPAVAAALSVVKEHRDDVERIEFHYGSYCPPGARCLARAEDHGYVVFQFRGSPGDMTDYAGDFMVSVEADHQGKVTPTSRLTLLPTTPIIN